MDAVEVCNREIVAVTPWEQNTNTGVLNTCAYKQCKAREGINSATQPATRDLSRTKHISPIINAVKVYHLLFLTYFSYSVGYMRVNDLKRISVGLA